jgi:hypothetical protein
LEQKQSSVSLVQPPSVSTLQAQPEMPNLRKALEIVINTITQDSSKPCKFPYPKEDLWEQLILLHPQWTGVDLSSVRVAFDAIAEAMECVFPEEKFLQNPRNWQLVRKPLPAKPLIKSDLLTRVIDMVQKWSECVPGDNTDQLLRREMRAEEHDWDSMELQEVLVADEVAAMIWDDLMMDAAQVFHYSNT